MYKLFLCFRYLFRRRIVLVPILAVMLCVAMDLIVTSIMGGFLDTVKTAARGLFGDVIISANSLAGFGYYDTYADAEGNSHEGLVSRLRALDEVRQATPVIESVGMLRMADPIHRGYSKPVQVLGIRPAEYAAVTEFQDSLFYMRPRPARPVTDPDSPNYEPLADTDWQGPPSFELAPRVGEAPVPLVNLAPRDEELVGLIAGVRVLWPEPDKRGHFSRRGELPPGFEAVQLTLMPMRASGTLADAPVMRQFRLLDTSYTKIQQIDSMAVYVPFDKFQDYLEMGASAEAVGGFRAPARASRVLVKLADGVDLAAGRDAVAAAVRAWKQQRLAALLAAPPAKWGSMEYYEPFRLAPRGDDYVLRPGDWLALVFPTHPELTGPLRVADDGTIQPAPLTAPVRAADRSIGELGQELTRQLASHIDDPLVQLLVPDDVDRSGVQVQVWEQANANYFSAIENQKVIVLVMVGVVSLTAIALIWVIFVMIVVEKTKDIGIIKSVGGSASGVAAIFLGWAAVIGAIGTVLGGLLGWLFVEHINRIERWLSDLLGTQIWDPSAYLFDRIPARFHWGEMLVIGAAAVVAAMVGALLPAVRAGRMDPVEALRYE